VHRITSIGNGRACIKMSVNLTLSLCPFDILWLYPEYIILPTENRHPKDQLEEVIALSGNIRHREQDVMYRWKSPGRWEKHLMSCSTLLQRDPCSTEVLWGPASYEPVSPSWEGAPGHSFRMTGAWVSQNLTICLRDCLLVFVRNSSHKPNYFTWS
jgi:hypothetical protein